MTIVTLTSDFGVHDYDVAAIKGAMLHSERNLLFVDISHNIKHHDIVQAAFVFKNAWHHFPEGTIHVLSVKNFDEAHKGFLLIRHAGHYFIGPDNGVFWLVFGQMPAEVYQLPLPAPSRFPLCAVYAQAVGHIATQKPLQELGSPTQTMVQRIALQPVTTVSQIRGSVIYIDNFDNVIINIAQDLFEKVGRGRTFALYFKQHDPIRKLSTHFYDVPIGDTLCRFNSAGFLQIAIYMGRAATLLGLQVDDIIQIDFYNKK